MQFLPFDSNLFDYPVYALSLSNIKEVIEIAKIALELKQKKGKLLYLFLKEKAGFESIETPDYAIQFVDEKVNYKYKLPKKKSIVKSKKTFSEPTINNDALLSLAYESGRFSRFKIDPNFMDNEFEQLYQLWLAKSLNREIANAVYTVDIDEIPRGLITLKIDEEAQVSIIGLLAVDADSQQQGMGKALVKKAMAFSSQQKLKEVKVATQRNNMGACRFYEKMGFKEESNVFVYHLWIK